VHAWLPRGPADPEGACDDVAAGDKAGQRVLANALEPWTEKYPHVPVEPRLVRGDPVRSLVAESAGAALTVVGTRGRGGLRGVLPGSPSRLLLRHAHCPVAVLRGPP
jgi:nucleotide-binding universal stress UspA family protein